MSTLQLLVRKLSNLTCLAYTSGRRVVGVAEGGGGGEDGGDVLGDGGVAS